MESASSSLLESLFEEPPPSGLQTTNDFLITNDQIVAEANALQQSQLSVELAAWVDGYKRVGDRDPYLWTWCQRGVQLTTLPCVLDDRRADLYDTKVLGVMLDVLLDDVADTGGDERLLEHLICLPDLEHTSAWCASDEQEEAYADFAERVWKEVDRRVRSFPRHEELAELLRYDYRQLMNTMRYSHLLNRFPALLNLAEHDLYLPHNMHMMVSATMDLMCSPQFDLQEIGRVREAIYHAQYMGRIGNLVTTWQREIAERDFTSGIFARAVIRGDVSIDRLEHDDPADLANAVREGGHEEHFLLKWQSHRRSIIRLMSSIHSVDLGPLVRGLEQLICLHLASRGLK